MPSSKGNSFPESFKRIKLLFSFPSNSNFNVLNFSLFKNLIISGLLSLYFLIKLFQYIWKLISLLIIFTKLSQSFAELTKYFSVNILLLLILLLLLSLFNNSFELFESLFI